MLAAAFASGVAAEGIEVVDLGVVPTPVVAFMAAAAGSPGAVISASHNPYPDNGIKLFAAGGVKLRDDQAAAVEADMASGVVSLLTDDHIGRLVVDAAAPARYVDNRVGTLEGRDLSGATVVLDTANGAAVATAAEVFERAGARVVEVIGAAPDGRNINSGCGSTDPGALAEAVSRTKATLGLAFDGDADRVVAVDDRAGVADEDEATATAPRRGSSSTSAAPSIVRRRRAVRCRRRAPLSADGCGGIVSRSTTNRSGRPRPARR
jgi:phosphoglucosamine mutase